VLGVPAVTATFKATVPLPVDTVINGLNKICVRAVDTQGTPGDAACMTV
jgi:hypothetical protein